MGGRGASSSLTKKTSVEKILDDIKTINPNYSTGERKWKENCQSCTLAFILREKGENVEAIGNTTGWYYDNSGNKFTIMDAFNNNPAKWYYIVGQRRFDNESNAREYARSTSFTHIYRMQVTEKSIFTNSSDAIEDEVRKWGSGASGFIKVQWKGNQGGHVFNIKNINGDVVAIDAQNGKVKDLKQTLTRVKPQYTFITRTDNLKVKENVKKYMVKGAK